MRLRNKILTIILFFIPIMLITNVNAEEYSRKDMQDMVTSTALSYYYNNLFSDYGQYLKDSSYGFKNTNIGGTYTWRSFIHSPESISRANKYFIDCSSFAGITYKYGLGYDFSDYYQKSRYSYFKNGKKYGYYNMTTSNIKAFPAVFYTTKQTQSLYKQMLNNMGLDNDGAYYANISKNVASQSKTNFSTVTGAYINNSKSNKTQAVYYFEATGTTVKEIQNQINGKQEKVYNEIKEILQPGDMLTYAFRVKNSDGSATGNKGHVMIYVGNEINDNEQGLIHSTGYDYTYNEDGSMNNPGDDTYSVRYDTIDYLKDIILSESNTIIGYRVSIQRPINQFCNGDSCIFKDDSSSFSKAIDKNLIKNSLARKELSRLRIDHYAMIDKTYQNSNLSNVLSAYNSVNLDDSIKYVIQIQNKANYSYCSRSNTYTKRACERKNYTWNYSEKSSKYSYKNLTITSQIPNNTKYISGSCNNNCTYDEKSKTITWKINEIKPNSKMETNVYSASNPTYTYTYKVIPLKEGIINNDKINIITENNKVLTLGNIKTSVNPTFNGVSTKTVEDNLNKINQLISLNKISYKTSSSNSYKYDLDSLKNKISLSDDEFIKMLYYNSFDLDLGYLNINNIVSAIFNKTNITAKNETKTIYYTKNQTNINSLTGTLKTIHDMLVPGMYGGRVLHGNDNGDGEKMITARNNSFYSGMGLNNFEYGDLIVTISNNMQKLNIFMYKGQDSAGYPIFIEYTKNGISEYDKNSLSGKTGFQKMAEIYSKDLFCVLRPSRIGTTINYNFNGGKGKETSYIAFSTYKNLTIPSKEPYKVTINYNKNVSSEYGKNLESKNTFEGWYSNKELTSKIQNNTKLITTKNHTIYAKYVTSKIKLPDIQVDDYRIEGYYSDDSLTKKVGLPGSNYIPQRSETLYVKWVRDKYKITYHLDGGINNLNNSSSYNENEIKKLYAPSRKGYTFEGWYTDANYTKKATEISGNSDIDLYAKWVIKKYDIFYNLNGGVNHKNNLNSYNYKETIMLNNPTRDGYTFEGWYLEKTYNTKITKITIKQNITLYAKWKKIDIKVSVPTNLKAKALNYISIRLTWNRQSNVDGYQVYKYDKNKYILIKTTNTNNLITTYRNKTGYYSYYKIRAYKVQNDKYYYSNFSKIVKAKPFLKPPTNLKVKKLNRTSVKLTWKKTSGAKYYALYRYNAKTKKYVYLKYTSNTYITNKKLKKGKMYYYKIKAYKIENSKKVYSSFSKMVKIKM